jgi:hypothetical protein
VVTPRIVQWFDRHVRPADLQVSSADGGAVYKEMVSVAQ